MARRDRVGAGIAATLLVVVVFVAGTILAVVAAGGGGDNDGGEDRSVDGSQPEASQVTPEPPVVPIEVARASAVLIDAVGCSLDNQGSGVVTAAGVVTNAHVVAGATEITVRTEDGVRVPAELRAFDPVRDLALLAVPGLDIAPLETASPRGGTDATALVRASDEVDVAEVRIERTINIVSADIYGDGEHRRRGMELAAQIDAGDSGGAILDPAGRVVGIVFSASRTKVDVAYAVSADEITPLVEAAGDRSVESGPCLRP